MTNITHTTFALSLGLSTINIYPNFILLNEIPIYCLGLIIGSIFPDIDEPQSYIGKRIPLLSKIIKDTFGHRGLTHQFIFFLIPFITIFAFETKIKSINYELYLFLFGFILGIFFHQLGDMLSGSKKYKGGIKNYFYPFTNSDKYFTPFPKIFRCVVGDIKEQIYNVLFIFVIIFQIKEILNIKF